MFVILGTLTVKKSSFRKEFLRALKEDVESTLQYERRSCLVFEVVQDEKSANRFYLYEVYVEAAAFENHKKTKWYKKWEETVKDWIDPKESETVKCHNLFPPKLVRLKLFPSDFVWRVEIKVKAEHRREFEDRMKKDAETTLKRESGQCLRLDVLQDSTNLNKFYLYEVYVNTQAFDRHQDTSWFKEWQRATETWFVSKPKGNRCRRALLI